MDKYLNRQRTTIQFPSQFHANGADSRLKPLRFWNHSSRTPLRGREQFKPSKTPPWKLGKKVIDFCYVTFWKKLTVIPGNNITIACGNVQYFPFLFFKIYDFGVNFQPRSARVFVGQTERCPTKTYLANFLRSSPVCSTI